MEGEHVGTAVLIDGGCAHNFRDGLLLCPSGIILSGLHSSDISSVGYLHGKSPEDLSPLDEKSETVDTNENKHR
jgi:hypothetical protein